MELEVAFQGRSTEQPYAIHTDYVNTDFNVGLDVRINASALSSIAGGNGRGTFFFNLLPHGTYDVWVKHDQYLAHRQRVNFSETSTPVSLVIMRAGDVNNDNQVSLQDFSLLAASFNKTTGQNSFDTRADFNLDDAVTLQDFSLLVSSFNRTGASQP
jgi:hypothetical protein